MSDEKPELSSEADYRFLSLVMSLATAAWSQLGKVPHPVTQKLEKDLDQARDLDRVLRMLQEKTEGNLSVKELELIDNTVADLELNFADEVRKTEASGENKTPDIILPSGVSSKGPEIIKP